MAESSSTSAIRRPIAGILPSFFVTFPRLVPACARACARNEPAQSRVAQSRGTEMENCKSGIVDFLELGANAFVSGLVAAIALSVIALALSTSARAAAPNGQQTGSLLVRPAESADYSVAPKLETEVAIRVTGM